MGWKDRTNIFLCLAFILFLVGFTTACCGNGIITSDEQCDDGNQVDGDGCSSICEIESPIIYNLQINPKNPSCSDSLEICANVFSLGTLEFVKLSCNAGKTQINKTMILKDEDKYCAIISNITLGATDGLEVLCKIFAQDEFGYDKEEIFSVYDCSPPEPPFCGDGNVDAGEECDDGNTDNGDGCSAQCYVEIPSVLCGNGVIDLGAGEQCDDGTLNGHLCDNSDSSCEYCNLSCQIIERDEKKHNNGNDFKMLDFLASCESNWQCSSWTECQKGVTTRICTDINSCPISYNKPIESAGCNEEIISSVLIEKKNSNLLLIILVITFILFIILLGFLAKTKKY